MVKGKKKKVYRINIASITDTFWDVDRRSKCFEWRVHAGQEFWFNTVIGCVVVPLAFGLDVAIYTFAVEKCQYFSQ